MNNPMSPCTEKRFSLRLKSVHGLSTWLALALLLAMLSCPGLLVGETSPWKEVDRGLWVAEFDRAPGGEGNAFKITVVKIDPQHYAFKLLSASEYDRQKMSVREWCSKHQLVAAVNAGMFQQDGITSVGFMKNYGHLNNPRVGRDNTVLAFNPKDSSVPEVQIIDLECQDFNTLRRKYHSMLQSIRMVSCERKNVWNQQTSKWNTVAIGMDDQGKILILFSRIPSSVHDFIDQLLALPIGLQKAMYLEGGHEASLYLSSNQTTIERYGGLEAAFEGGNALSLEWPIPNVIGIVKKSATPS